MKSTIKVALAVFAIVAAVGLFAASTVVYTAEATVCPSGKRLLVTPGGDKCISDKAKAPPFVPPN